MGLFCRKAHNHHIVYVYVLGHARMSHLKWDHCDLDHKPLVVPSIVTWDFNKDCSKKTLASKQLSDLMKYYGFHPCIRHPTHRQGGILDTFYHNSYLQIHVCRHNIYILYWSSYFCRVHLLKWSSSIIIRLYWFQNTDWLNKLKNGVNAPYTYMCRCRRGRMDLQLPVQSVPITTKVVHGEMYSIQHHVIKFVSDLRKVNGFLMVLIKLTAMI